MIDYNDEEAVSEYLDTEKAARAKALQFGDELADKITDFTKAEGFSGFMTVDSIISRLLIRFGSCGEDVNFQHVNWWMEKYVAHEVDAKLLPDLNKLYDVCVKHNLTEQNDLNHNDGDNTLFFIPHDKYKIICTTSQNLNYIYSWDKYELHIRRYYNKWKLKDDYDKEENAEYVGIEFAIKNARDLVDNWADDVLGNRYVHRPSLDWYKQKDFEPCYKDSRDAGYVLSYRASLGGLTEAEVDNVLYHPYEIWYAFFDVGCALTAIEEEL